jgi:uncharacterized protein (DUF1800 family)
VTGWTFVTPQTQRAAAAPIVQVVSPGRSEDIPGFWFNDRLHDQGEKQWLGQRVEPRGKAEGDFALDLLARHPATARHISFKLAQYFVGDQPDSALVDRLAKVFLAEDGQIVPVLRTLFASDAFWSAASFGAKFKTPYQFAISTLRAGAYELGNVQPLAQQMAVQGMPLFGCQTPDGYKNTESAWLNPDGLAKRFDFAAQVAAGRLGPERLAGGLDADALMQQLGPLVTPATRSLVAEKRNMPVVAVAMVLASPGMMHR